MGTVCGQKDSSASEVSCGLDKTGTADGTHAAIALSKLTTCLASKDGEGWLVSQHGGYVGAISEGLCRQQLDNIDFPIHCILGQHGMAIATTLSPGPCSRLPLDRGKGSRQDKGVSRGLPCYDLSSMAGNPGSFGAS